MNKLRQKINQIYIIIMMDDEHVNDNKWKG